MISSEEKIKRRKMWWKVVVARNALLVARAKRDGTQSEAGNMYTNAYNAFTVYVDFGKKGRAGRTIVSDIDNSGWFDLLDVDGEDYKWEDPL